MCASVKYNYTRPRSAERYSGTLRLSVCMTLHMITETPLKLGSPSELHVIILILRHPVWVCMSLGGKGWKVGACFSLSDCQFEE